MRLRGALRMHAASRAPGDLDPERPRVPELPAIAARSIEAPAKVIQPRCCRGARSRKFSRLFFAGIRNLRGIRSVQDVSWEETSRRGVGCWIMIVLEGKVMLVVSRRVCYVPGCYLRFNFSIC